MKDITKVMQAYCVLRHLYYTHSVKRDLYNPSLTLSFGQSEAVSAGCVWAKQRPAGALILWKRR